MKNNNTVLVVGSIGIDSITTPFDKAADFLGGSATYASLGASFFSKPIMLSSCGTDVPKGSLDKIAQAGVDVSHILKAGKTFRWHSQYDLNGNVTTLKTQFEGTTDKFPEVPKPHPAFVLLANHNPEIHLKILDSLTPGTFVLADTMEFWLNTQLDKVMQVIKRVNALSVTEAEAKQIVKTPNTIVAGRFLLEQGPEFVCLKKGEHGVLLFSKNGLFSVGAYPLEEVVDPTGAGDSFAGALIGYLSKNQKIAYKTIKEAVVWAAAVASVTSEKIGPAALFSLNQNQIKERFNAIIQLHQL